MVSLNQLIVDAIIEMKSLAKTEESLRRDLNSLIDVYSHAVELSVVNRVMALAKSKDLPHETIEMIHDIHGKSHGALQTFLSDVSRAKTSDFLAKLIFLRSYPDKNWESQDDQVKAHYISISNSWLIKLSPYLYENAVNMNKKMMDAVYSSLSELRNDLMSDDEVADLRHRAMVDISNAYSSN